MQTKLFFSTLCSLVVVFTNVHCSKDHSEIQVESPPPPSTTRIFFNPTASAGSDKYIDTPPANECFLTGWVFDADSDIDHVLWTKIAGPDDPTIINPTSLSTGVGNLKPGIYLFELTVTDSTGLQGRDTCKVSVARVGTGLNEIILPNMAWIFPWFNAIEIEDFHMLVPDGTAFHLFIKREDSHQWLNVSRVSQQINNTYEYIIETRPHGAGMYNYGSLYIYYYGTDVSDTPDVSIRY